MLRTAEKCERWGRTIARKVRTRAHLKLQNVRLSFTRFSQSEGSLTGQQPAGRTASLHLDTDMAIRYCPAHGEVEWPLFCHGPCENRTILELGVQAVVTW